MQAKKSTFDVVIWGASGFTGRLVAEYLAQQYGVSGANLRWAMAGRSVEKLRAVAQEVGAEGVEILQGDAADPDSLAAIAQQTKVICTTVGPYQKYGAPLVAACVEAGTGYVDLCGEPPFMRRMIDQYHARARETGAKIVHSCGFDSIPFDLGVFFLQQIAIERSGAPAPLVKGRVVDMKGAMSGGTAASALATIEAVGKDRQAREVMADIYSLAPDETAKRPRQPNMRSPHYDRDLGKWVIPFIMADINARNVHRTNLLSDYLYGEGFQYSEMMTAPNGPAAMMMTGGLGGFAGALAFPPTRAILKALVLPKPGEGPSRSQRESGYFDIRLIAKGDEGVIAQARVTGDRDPGYGSTSKMLAEAAICLAVDLEDDASGGVWTAGALMGGPLISRLERNAGLQFTHLKRQDD